VRTLWLLGVVLMGASIALGFIAGRPPHWSRWCVLGVVVIGYLIARRRYRVSMVDATSEQLRRRYGVNDPNC